MASRQQAKEIFGPARAARPDERECAMLVALLLTTKQREVGKEVTRAQLTGSTLRRIFGRQRISAEFLLQVQEWLFRAGWVLFPTLGAYAVVKVNTIAGWARISSKRIGDDLQKVARGQFDFDSLETLLLEPESAEAEDD